MLSSKPKSFPRYKQAVDDFVLNAADAGTPAAFVVFSLAEHRFLRFDGATRAACVADYAAFVAREYTARGRVPDFQEVVNQRTWHALVFDVDLNVALEEVATRELYDARVARFRESLHAIVTGICDVCYDMFDIAIGRDDCIVCESLDPREPIRLAAHIIVARAIPHFTIGRQFATQLIAILDPADGAMIDRGFYCTQHNLRIAGCAKVGSSRIKALPPGRSLLDTIVGATSTMRIPEERAEYWRTRLQGNAPDESTGTTARTSSATHLSADDISRACAVVDARHGEGAHKLRTTCDSLLIFTRCKPSHCQLCDRTHDHDSTLMVRVVREFGMLRFIESCRKYNAEHPQESKRDEIGSAMIDDGIERAIARATARNVATTSNVIDDDARDDDAGTADSARDARVAPAIPSWESRFALETYSEPVMRPYPADVRTLLVHAPMKIGKTKELKRFVAANASDETHRVIFLSFRRTFTSEIAAHFRDFVSYREIRGELDAPRMIIQVESLHRVVPDKLGRVDLLIMDESESIISQFESGLSGDHAGDFAVFQWLVRYAGRVIALDAFMSERTCAVIGRMRGVEGARIVRNTYQNAARDAYYFTSSRELWLLALMRCVERGERVVVCANSAKEGRALCEMIARIEGGAEIRLKYYCAETSCTEKARDFANVRECWTECDILIYTPTLTAGVSFEEAHFDRMFGYFTDRSCSAQVCVQMMGRVRDIANRQFFICLNTTPGAYPITRDDVIMALRIKKCAISAEAGAIDVEYTAAGLPTIPDTDYAELCVQNVISRNMSRNDFTGELIRFITLPGARAMRLTAAVFGVIFGAIPTFDELADMRGQRADVGSAVELVRARAIASARELEGAEYAPLAERITGGVIEVPDADRAAATKYELRAIYDMREDMTPDFVQTYADLGVIAAFKNLRTLCDAMTRAGDVARAIADMKRMESEHMRELGANAERDPEGVRELGFVGRYEMHRVVHLAVGAIGFRDVFDRRVIPHVDVGETIRANTATIRRIWPSLCATFKIPPSLARDVITGGSVNMRLYLTAIDVVVREAYAIRVMNVGEICQLTRPEWFTIRMDNKVITK